jgi:hypothetical protein
MKKGIETKILLVLILAALVLNAYVSFTGKGRGDGTLLNPSPAQAKIYSEGYYRVIDDTYIITTDSNGTSLFLYYFEKGPKVEDSKLQYVTRVQAQ